MSLRFRLNLIITVMFFMIIVLGSVLVIQSARRAVLEETESTARLALELLDASASEPDQQLVGSLQARLRESLHALDDVRHLHIALRENDRELPLGDPGATDAATAPAWFVRLVEPRPVEFRRPLADTDAEIVVRADAGDEISESWQEARAMLGLLLLFSLTANGVLYALTGLWLKPVKEIAAAMDGIEQGDYNARLAAFDLPELADIAAKFNRMAEVLDHTREQNRHLAQQSLAVQEAERRALAQELHDELGQSISAIKAMAVSIGHGGARGHDQIASAASTIETISSDMYTSVRGMMRRLRPVLLDEFGLVRALQDLVDGWNERHADAFCRFTHSGDLGKLGDELNIGVYRIVQECLTNVSKHSDATEVAIRLERGPHANGDRVTLSIHDDGRGFDSSMIGGGLGLLGLRERVESLRGTFQLHTAVGSGTEIDVSIPIAGARG